MRAEVIAIGTELTTGQKLDTNSQWLSTELAAIGISVHYHMTVADGLEEMVEMLRLATTRSDLVLITGGLGPTLDDLTRQALARLAGVDLVEHDESLQQIRQMFAARGRSMPARNSIQAMFPQGAEPMPNPHGTAPGIWLSLPAANRTGTCRLAALPGVPAEMKPMFRSHVLPRLPQGQMVIRRLLVHCFGAGESQVEEMLGEMTARGRDPEVGITAHEATITLRITAEGSTVEACNAKLQSTRLAAEEILGDLVFGYGDDELEDVVARQLAARERNVAVSEIGTSGLLSHLLSLAGDDSGVFRGGIVLPHGAAAGEAGLSASSRNENLTATERGLAMARACRDRFSADFGLAVSDWVENQNGVIETAVAVVGDGCELTENVTMLADSSIHRSRTAKVVINLLRRHLLEHS